MTAEIVITAVIASLFWLVVIWVIVHYWTGSVKIANRVIADERARNLELRKMCGDWNRMYAELQSRLDRRAEVGPTDDPDWWKRL